MSELHDDPQGQPEGLPHEQSAEVQRERVLVRRRSRRFKKQRLTRRILWAVGILLVVTALQLIWALFNLHGLPDKFRLALQATRSGDTAAARAYIAEAHDEATRASWGTWGPQFWLVEQLPWVGDNVRAVRTMSTAARDVTGPVADDLLTLQQQLAPKRIRPVNSYINPDFFAGAQSAAQDLAGRMAPVQSRTDAVPTGGLLPGLGAKWAEFRNEIDKIGFAAQLTNNVVKMVPAALGTHGTRRYLIAFQNNAEFRSTGGIVGAFSELTVTDGHMKLGPKQSASTVPKFDAPVLPLTAEETALYGSRPAQYTQDVNLTPDFPRSAQLLAAMWKQHSGHHIDGVFSIDPVALSYVLRGTGPVAANNGVMLTAQNAVGQLLNAPYVVLGAYAEQQDYFASAVHNVFDALVHGQGDAGVALKGVFDGIDEGRAMVWMAAPTEQSALLDAPATKQLSTVAAHSPDIGVYLNDSTSTKLDYYVTSRTSVTSVSCGGGRQVLNVTTTLHSYVPSDILSNLALRALLVGPLVDDSPGDLLLSVYAYGPLNGTLLDTTLDGQAGSPGKFVHDGHPVVSRTVLIKPGESKTLRYSFQAMKGETGDPLLRTTPAAFGDGRGSVGPTSC
ncbi:hypothetical protein Back2_14230 [Nocardioides baekrokdamisoli]|uniref:DUF4012 domain-containing protein n=1 Tax=Nocardioides baekrokdamisoli TaxID=1804624 RepID=A0A3G9IFP3_9ACTN|nr:DUF4012 domain-containing protein [Nocardioides baekrokdamisoli]BBH17136.1 hypothetical protein Back2_14230 [Nocardioides baekrokdamisoli]